MNSELKNLRMINRSMQPMGVDPGPGDEYFTNGIFMFNISALNTYIDNHPDEFQMVEIDVRTYHNHFRRPEYNSQFVQEADIDRPVILAEIAPDRLYHGYPTIDKEFFSRGYNLIDGHHRLYKANELNYEKIWAWTVPMELHCQFMYDGFEEYIGYWNGKLTRFK